MKLAIPTLAAALAVLSASPSQAQRPYGPNPYYQPQYGSPFNRYYGPGGYNQAGDPRHVWVYNYNEYAQGAFEDMGNGWWQETNPEAGFRYQEVRRTPAYVELLDPDRHLVVRLCNDHLLQRQQFGYGGWQNGYSGRWQ